MTMEEVEKGSKITSARANIEREWWTKTEIAGVKTFMSALKEVAKGNGVLAGLSVTEQSPKALGVTVGKGRAIVNGRLVSIVSTTNVTIATADSTYPRKDIIVLASDGGLSAVEGTKEAAVPNDLTGSGTLKPEASDVPANKIVLAEVWVQNGETEIANADVTDRRMFREGLQVQNANINLTAAAFAENGKMRLLMRTLADRTSKTIGMVRFGPYETTQWNAKMTGTSEDGYLVFPGGAEEVPAPPYAELGYQDALYFRLSGTTYQSVTNEAGAIQTEALAGQDWTADTIFKTEWTGTSVKFYTNGTLRSTHSTRVPTTQMIRFFEIVSDATPEHDHELEVDEAFIRFTDTPI